jgi:hypothetical protein
MKQGEARIGAGWKMKTIMLSALIIALSIYCGAASDTTGVVTQPSIFWHEGQWQTWNNGVWTPYGQKPTTTAENVSDELKRSGSHSNQPLDSERKRRTQRAALSNSGVAHLRNKTQPASAQGLPIGPPNLEIGKPNVGVGQTTIGIGQPTIGIGRPSTGIGQTTIGIGQPATGIGQTTIGIGQATTGIGRRTIGIGQPTIGIGQPNGGVGPTN